MHRQKAGRNKTKILIVSGDRWRQMTGLISLLLHIDSFHMAYKECVVGFEECVVELKVKVQR